MLDDAAQGSRTEGARLIQAVAGADEAAMGALYDAFGAYAYGAALRITRDPGLAEDAVQEAFVGIWRNAHRYRPDLSSPRTWIVSIARNRAIDLMRRRRGIPVLADSAGSSNEATEPDAWSMVAAGLDRELVAGLLRELPSAQRQAIELAFLKGLTHREIAIATAAPLGTVKSRVRLGLLRLRALLEAAEGAVTDAEIEPAAPMTVVASA